MRRAIFLPGKAPRPGLAKTRLSPPLTPEQAAALYHGFLHDSTTLAVSLGWERVTLMHPEPREGEEALARLLPAEVRLLPQPATDFGEILASGFSHHFAEGFDRVVLIGSDTPTLPASIVQDAAAILGDHDLAIGPTEDGGYYLLAMTRQHRRLFEDVAWSTARVAAQTRERAEELGLDVVTLPSWYDVDDAAALARLRADLLQAPAGIAPATRRSLASVPRWGAHTSPNGVR